MVTVKVKKENNKVLIVDITGLAERYSYTGVHDVIAYNSSLGATIETRLNDDILTYCVLMRNMRYTELSFNTRINTIKKIIDVEVEEV